MEAIHPALVHFPIALIIVALLGELMRLWAPKICVPDATVRFLLWGALIGVAIAYISGHLEFENLPELDPTGEVALAIAAHELPARLLLWTFPVTVLLFELSVRARTDTRAALAWVYRCTLLSAVALVILIAIRGGGLVREFGLGTRFSQVIPTPEP